jgi:hypothetical protein
LVLFVASTASGCKGKGDDDQAERAKRWAALAMSEEARARAQGEIDAWKKRAWPRSPLVTKGAPTGECKAGDRYDEAIALAEKHEGLLWKLRDQKPWRPENWGDARATLAAFLASEDAQRIADAVRTGAACCDGDSSGDALPWGGRDMLETTRTAQTTSMLALLWSERGQAAQASYLLLATLQMGYDMQRGGNFVHTMIGERVLEVPLEALQHVAKQLSAEETAEVYTACRLVLAGRPKWDGSLYGERISMLAMWIAMNDATPGSDPDEGEDEFAWLEKRGGAEGFHRDMKRGFAMMAGADDKPLPQVLKLAQDARRTIWGDLPKTMDFRRLLVRRRKSAARLTANCLALAVHAEQKKTGAWPKDLGFLPATPIDPLSGKPFEYEPGKAIRSIPVDCGAVTECDATKIGRVEVALD